MHWHLPRVPDLSGRRRERRMTHESMAKVTSVSTRQTKDTEQPMYVMDESATWCPRVSCVGSRAEVSTLVQILEVPEAEVSVERVPGLVHS